MAETIPGGQYETADGRLVDANGNQLEMADDLTVVTGIGKATARKLTTAGIKTVQQLQQTAVADLVAATGVSDEQAQVWLDWKPDQ